MHTRLEEYGTIDYRHTLSRFEFRYGKWYSKECSSTGDCRRRINETDAYSCLSCYSAFKSITKKTCPLLWGNVPFGKLSKLLPDQWTVEQAVKLVVVEEEGSEARMASGLSLVESLQSSKELREIIELLNMVNTEWVGIEKNNVLVAPCCSNSQLCAKFVVASSTGYSRQTCTCDACSKSDVAKDKRDGRRETVLENASDLTQPVRLDQMLNSPDKERIGKRLEAKDDFIAEQARRIAYLEARLELESVEVQMNSDDPRDSDVEDRMQTLAAILDEVILQNAGSGAVLDEALTAKVTSAKERAQFIQVTMSNIRNFVKQCEGKPTAVRYHPAVMRAAMAMAYRSPAGYEKMRAAGFVVSPTYKHVQRKGSHFKGKEGANKKIYENILDFNKNLPTLDVLHGILICDEITLRSGLAFNTRSHAVVGFAGETDSFGSDLVKAMSPDGYADESEADEETTEEDDEKSGHGNRNKSKKRCAVALGKKANVWMFRYGRNQRFHLEYFINDGNLDGAAILAQYNIVVVNLRNIGCKVAGVMCDAGGGNQGWYRLLRRNKLIPDDSTIYIGNELVFAIHPIDPEWPPCLIHCASHLIKSLRNQLYASRTSGTRSLIDKFGQKIIWEFFEELLELSRQNSVFGITKMKSACVYGLDRSWAKMDVSNAKRMFAMDTVNFAIKTFVDKFNAKLKEVLPETTEKDLLKFWTASEVAEMFRSLKSKRRVLIVWASCHAMTYSALWGGLSRISLTVARRKGTNGYVTSCASCGCSIQTLEMMNSIARTSTVTCSVVSRGGLALLSARIFPWAKMSLEFICGKLTYAGVAKAKSKCLENMWQKVRDKEGLYDMFVEATASYRETAEIPISDNEARSIAAEWLLKAFHVRGKEVFAAIKDLVEGRERVQVRSYLKSVGSQKIVKANQKRKPHTDAMSVCTKRPKK